MSRGSKPEPWDAFAVAPPGTEPIVASELVALGIRDARVVDGGVEFPADRTTIYRANLHLRTASRILVRLATFRAISFAELEQRARRVPWDRVLPGGASFQLRVTCRKSRLYHSGGVAERLARDITARLAGVVTGAGDPGDDGDLAQLFVVRLDRDRCTISADSSGAHLHQRGYRTAVTGAPLRENLAAALVLATGWVPDHPLLDPFCGSGTIPIEAAMIAARLAPGFRRDFRFMHWPDFDATGWSRVLARAGDAGPSRMPAPIVASDRSAAAIKAARDNAERAGVASLIQFEQRDVRDLVPPAGSPGWVVTNPPYGVRLGSRDEARRLYDVFADVLEERFGGWRVGALVGAGGAAAALGLPDELLRTTNGGLAVRFLAGEVPDGATSAGPEPRRRGGRRR